MTTKPTNTIEIDVLSKAGVHYGRQRGRRHPSAKDFIFGTKGNIEIFDLESTKTMLERALVAAQAVGEKGGQILMVAGKSEAKGAVKDAASSAGLPFVAGRFIGGTLTNFPEIKKRVARLESLTEQKEKGELAKYTKKERLLLDREIDSLREMFGGITPMRSLPAMLYVVDPRKENIAVREANLLNIPVMALAGSDCNMKELTYAIPGNDALPSSVRLITDKIAHAYKEGKKAGKAE
ncbi:MAG: 30S ribosomal protein S2 [Minisyncoccia bacterium]